MFPLVVLCFPDSWWCLYPLLVSVNFKTVSTGWLQKGKDFISVTQPGVGSWDSVFWWHPQAVGGSLPGSLGSVVQQCLWGLWWAGLAGGVSSWMGPAGGALWSGGVVCVAAVPSLRSVCTSRWKPLLAFNFLTVSRWSSCANSFSFLHEVRQKWASWGVPWNAGKVGYAPWSLFSPLERSWAKGDPSWCWCAGLGGVGGQCRQSETVLLILLNVIFLSFHALLGCCSLFPGFWNSHKGILVHG